MYPAQDQARKDASPGRPRGRVGMMILKENWLITNPGFREEERKRLKTEGQQNILWAGISQQEEHKNTQGGRAGLGEKGAKRNNRGSLFSKE